MTGYEQENYAGYVENAEDDDYEEYKTPAKKESYGRRKTQVEKESVMKPKDTSQSVRQNQLRKHKELMQDKTPRTSLSNTSRLYGGVAAYVTENEDYSDRIASMLRADDPPPEK
jgi:hypothetical protein